MNCAPNTEMRPFTVKNALVVGADPQIGTLLLSVLRPDSWVILTVPDNLAALALSRAKAFDLIVTSEKTSGREDIELLRQIRRVRPHTRLIILASESTPADVITSMRERAFSYFSKPFSLEELSEMIYIAAEGPCWVRVTWLRVTSLIQAQALRSTKSLMRRSLTPPTTQSATLPYARNKVRVRVAWAFF